MNMKVDKNMTNIICNIEYIIGDETYNPNSYNGWTCEEGCSFRYPVNYCKNKEDLEEEILSKTKYKIDNIDPECINTMKYKFGSNHLYIGNGIVKALEFLEKRYNLDFVALEEQKRLNVKEKLDAGNLASIFSGRWIIGKDLSEGTYVIINNGKIPVYSTVRILNENDTSRSVYLLSQENEVQLYDGQTLIVQTECPIRKK